VSNLTNTDGSVRCSYQYDAWGNFRSECNASWNKRTFTGKEWDKETGLYYFGARFYDPEVGRFTTQDAYLGDMNTPPSLHRYLYAYANPTVFVDLAGYDSLRWEMDQSAKRAARQGGFWGISKLVGLVAGQTLYKATNVLTFGWIDKHDDARDAYDRGKIDRLEYVQRAGKAGVKSAALIGATALTGGAGALLAKGMSTTARFMVGGASTGIGAQAVEDAWRGQLSSGGTYLRSALVGGALGYAGSKAVKLKSFLGDAGVKEGIQKLRWTRAAKSSRSGGEALGASWHKVVEKPPLMQRAAEQARVTAKAAASKLRNMAGHVRELPRRLNIMSKMDPGSGTYKRILEIERGLTEVSGKTIIPGAKFRGTGGVSHREQYDFMRRISNTGLGRLTWTNVGKNTKLFLQRARNLTQNLLTRKARRPEVKGGDDPYLSGDVDVISDADIYQGHSRKAVEARIRSAREGNQAAGIELFDIHTRAPSHGILGKALPPKFLKESLPNQSNKTVDLFGKGGKIRKPSKGDPWVEARFLIKMGK